MQRVLLEHCRCSVQAASSVQHRMTMFVLFSNRLGCFGSIIVSIVGTLLLVMLLRACTGTPSMW